MRRLCAVVLLGSISSANAGFISGNTLLEQCQSNEGVFYGHCMGYIAATVDTQYTLAAWNVITMSTCVPPDAPEKQLRQIVVKYLLENPKVLHKDASSIVMVALLEAFPCAPAPKK